ncbi:MAG: ammonia channel protein [Candidatus Raymondbacteria bacterium RifOxyA12_full_50_37]|nr:MAG: ammonia channel protein [Candidatus Raymondbacteria bacterium RifOxyA12_full_50_37]OGJ91306.1 MAG: ammonia channel protein [Candidatus Raymondbacteria bacterium RifOxyB12_full_50_8]OGJ92212.1 MAG: ammonia channel protein [Candidatus Raymondbacteria bacterium RIFOXYA2_FULL_49_16]OGJ98538.1 MAG: ammonia channel protein [Candidatus Raymondbacteria bacterium RIFOXYC2_FULL_50_21]OGK06734.1 MAG: ammonia channel protein [Candidatus Raymondbacteria bacterium RifOxyC12_full_50_8]OGP44207.1 MAG:
MMQAVNYTDVVFILLATALVMLMTTPGLAFFYGGLVRRKNVLSTMMQSFVMLCLVSLQWIFGGYSLAFGPDVGHFVGNLSWFGLHGVGMAPNPDYAATIPHQLFMVYQMMFAVITPALITGAFAERMKFSSCVVFCLLWTTLVYDPVCHWVWGSGGWLKERGVLDFAGGIVVHATSGISALVCALVLGRRKGYPGHGIPPHNMTYALLGASLLWFGWFGFNAGSALAANEVAVSAFIVTNTAAAAAALVWMAIEWRVIGKPTALGGATGAVAGLATITPAAGFVAPLFAVVIGVLAGGCCYMAVVLVKQRFEYDDSLDAFGVHGIGGILGVIATGLFAQKAINPAGNNGLFFSNPSFLNTQLFGVFVAIAYAALLSFVILKAVDAVLGLRVKDEEEVMGLDHTQHQESAYTLID